MAVETRLLGRVDALVVGATNYAVITVRDRKIRRYREFYDEAAALEAAGLRA
jgi:ketosteroid isomerase-like protein